MADMVFAQHRFGLGPHADESLSGDPKAWLLGQLEPPGSFLEKGDPALSDVADAIAGYFGTGRMRREAKEAGKPLDKDAVQKMRSGNRKTVRRQAGELAEARLDQALVTERPFAQRLVYFWSNHFATSSEMISMGGLSAMLEDGAVRPNIFGKFEDMLLAVTKHPAMLVYLDQFKSTGPRSRVGAKSAKNGGDVGLNENLARELLELHTLGVRSGYSQADVLELAKALTGWTVAGIGQGRAVKAAADAVPGSFVFLPATHEPGPRTLLGKTFDQKGAGQAEAMLRFMARHPATAKNIATKLARHFVADDPPAAMISRLERAYLASGGDLKQVTQALIDSPEAWDTRHRKFRAPWDWIVAVLRGLGKEDAARGLARSGLAELGQPTFVVPSPAGWSDLDGDWAGPDALIRRVELSYKLADRSSRQIDARQLAPQILGAQLTKPTEVQISRAESPQTALALLLASPEMLRR